MNNSNLKNIMTCLLYLFLFFHFIIRGYTSLLLLFFNINNNIYIVYYLYITILLSLSRYRNSIINYLMLFYGIFIIFKTYCCKDIAFYFVICDIISTLVLFFTS